MLEGVSPLLGVPAHPDVAVGHREEGLGDAEVAALRITLDESPRVHGEAAAVEAGLWGSARCSRELPEVGDDDVRPAAARTSAPAPRSTPMTRPKPPAAPARTPETASSTTAERAGVVPHSFAWTKVSGAGFPASRSEVATRPSTTVTKRSANPPPPSTAGGVRRRRDDGERHPLLTEEVEELDRTRVGVDAVAGEHRVEGVVLAVAESAHGAGVGGSLGSPSGSRMPRDARKSRTPS